MDSLCLGRELRPAEQRRSGDLGHAVGPDFFTTVDYC